MNLSRAKTLLKQRLARFTSASTTLDGFLEDELVAAQQRLEEGPLLPWFLQTRATVTTTSGQRTVALPSGFLRFRHDVDWPILYTNSDGGNVKVKLYTYEDLLSLYPGSGEPLRASLDGANLAVFPQPDDTYDLELAFYKKDDELEEGVTDTNNWLTHASELLIAEAGFVLSTGYLKSQSAAQMFERMRLEAQRRVHNASVAREIEGFDTPED